MSAKQTQRVGGVPVWGVFLIFLGIVFLLQSLNIFPWGIWETLWQFWPVLIIITGLSILMRHYNVWLVSLLVLALLGVCLGIAIWQYPVSPLVGITTKSYIEPLGSLRTAQIEVNFAAGSLNVGSLPSISTNLIEANYEVRTGESSIKIDFNSQNNDARLSLSTEQLGPHFWNEGGVKWTADLARGIPLTINIKSDASNMNLNLIDLDVTEFALDADVGNCIVIMPSSAGTTFANIKADVANIEITIPDGVAASIKTNKGLSAFEINKIRFPQNGDFYVSPNFETAQNRIELEIDSDVGRIAIK